LYLIATTIPHRAEEIQPIPIAVLPCFQLEFVKERKLKYEV